MGRLKVLIDRLVWDVRPSLSRWTGALLRTLRILYVVVRDLADGQLTLQAMSLVYTTLLSLVPLLAVSFSVLKGFGVHNQIEPLLLNFLAPLGEKGEEIAARVIEFVENMKVGVLGSVGLAMLFYTVISLVQKIERAFNYTWRTSRSRGLTQRFSDYLSVILIGPVLMFAAMGITASVTSTTVVQQLAAVEPFGTAIKIVSQFVPYVLVIAAFTFMYVFIPNTSVRVASALVGAVVAGVLWETTGWAFASFVVSSAKYTAIYSGFAILVMFMLWLYASWLILLIGASIAFYHQHPAYLAAKREELRLSCRVQEKLALSVMLLIGREYYSRRPTWTLDRLAQRLNVPRDAVWGIVNALERRRLLAETGDDPPTYLPIAALETVSIKEVLDAVRSAGEEGHVMSERLVDHEPVEEVLRRIDQGIADALEGLTVKDLALAQDGDQREGAGRRPVDAAGR